jgi:hypothetical protein
VNIYSDHQKRLTELELLEVWCRYTGSKGNRTATTARKEVIEMIIEMRTYKTTPGMRSRFLEIFHSKTIPAHREIGMKRGAGERPTAHVGKV